MFETVVQTEKVSFQLFSCPLICGVVIITLVMKGKLNTPDCPITATKQSLTYLNHGLCRGILLRKVKQHRLTGLGKQTHRSQWPRGLRRRSSAARLLRLWVRIPLGAWMSVCCECCVLSGRGLCDSLITLPEESYRLWRVVVCDQGTSKTRRLKPATGL